MENQLSALHKFVETRNPEHLEALLADDVKFHSPFVWKPKEGKEITLATLTTVASVFEEFRYIREVIDGKNCVLEFEARIGVLTMRGVDIIEFNDEGKAVDFEVMIRPMNALEVVGTEMTKRLEAKGLV
ncbi:MAG: nuclear transport factor 2 family protein [Pyrinomonadaceae bacterium]|nr:nuclear transport factor 2 family protein [Pyrinomonadaceae bacterium]